MPLCRLGSYALLLSEPADSKRKPRTRRIYVFEAPGLRVEGVGGSYEIDSELDQGDSVAAAIPG